MEVEWWVGCCDGGWGRDDGEEEVYSGDVGTRWRCMGCVV